MLESKKTVTVFMVILLLMTVTVTNSTYSSGTHSLSASAESMLSGGSSLSGLANGFIVGMGIATLLGCVWCPAAAILLKAASMYFS